MDLQSSDQESLQAKISDACARVGFLAVTGHAIPKVRIDEAA